MRVTTQMLNESARKAGLPVNRTSLLNYVNGNSSRDTLLNALNKKKASAADTARRQDYEKLEKSAGRLLQVSEDLRQEGENNLFERARSSGNWQEIYDSVNKLLESYNSTLKALSSASNTMNGFYRQMLTEAAGNHRESLEKLGITFGKDGSASVDMEKLQAADIDALEKAFGKDSDFSKKTAFLATRISDNAQANIENLSSGYNATGNSYSMSGNKYDFRG